MMGRSRGIFAHRRQFSAFPLRALRLLQSEHHSRVGMSHRYHQRRPCLRRWRSTYLSRLLALSCSVGGRRALAGGRTTQTVMGIR